MSTKENVLTILAVVFGVCLIGGGAYAIGLAVSAYTTVGFEAQVRFFAFVGGIYGVLFLIGGVLLLIRAFRVPKRNGKRISKG